MGRPITINQDLRDGITLEFEVGYLPSEVHRHLQTIGSPVSKRQCYRFYKRWQATGDLDPTYRRDDGRSRILGSYMIEELIEWLEHYPQSLLLDMAVFLYERFDIQPHLSTISQCLTRARYSRKRIQSVAAERNELLRADWQARISCYQPEQLLFLDESACSEKATRCRTGWSLFGVAPQIQNKLHCRERFSILPAYSMEGYVVWDVIPNSYNRERFLSFIEEKVLPICKRDWTVLCLDNASTHHSEVIVSISMSKC